MVNNLTRTSAGRGNWSKNAAILVRCMGAGVHLEQNCDAVSTNIEKTGTEQLTRDRGRGGAAGGFHGNAGLLLLEHHLDHAAHTVRAAALSGACAWQRAVPLHGAVASACDAPGGAVVFCAAPSGRDCRSMRGGRGCRDRRCGHRRKDRILGVDEIFFGQSSARRPS